MSAEDVHAGTRPSLFVVAVQCAVVACAGDTSFSLTAMPAPGLPVIVLRTWQVMKGRSAAIFDAGMWLEMVASRCEAVDIQSSGYCMLQLMWESPAYVCVGDGGAREERPHDKAGGRARKSIMLISSHDGAARLLPRHPHHLHIIIWQPTELSCPNDDLNAIMSGAHEDPIRLLPPITHAAALTRSKTRCRLKITKSRDYDAFYALYSLMQSTSACIVMHSNQVPT